MQQSKTKVVIKSSNFKDLYEWKQITTEYNQGKIKKK